jgi:TerB-C domain
MPDGSLETINEWAFERFDEPLLEDGDTLTVNISMLGPMADAAQSVSMASVQPMTGASA